MRAQPPPPPPQQQQQQPTYQPPSSSFDAYKIGTRVGLYFSYCWLSFITWSFLVELPNAITAYSTQQHTDYTSFYFILFYILPFALVNHKRFFHAHIALPFAFSLPSLLTVYWRQHHTARTITLAMGMCSSMLGFAQPWCNPARRQRELPQYCWLNGLIILILVRYHNYSVNPLWTSTTFALVTTVLTSIICIALIWHRRQYEKHGGMAAAGVIHYLSAPSTPTQVRHMYFVIEEDADAWDDDMDAELDARYVGASGGGGGGLVLWLRSGCAFGASLFLWHWLFSTHTLVPRWAGFEPFPACLLLLMALVVGLACAPMQLAAHPAVWVVLVGAMSMFSFAPPTISFIGAVIMAITLPSLWFTTIDRLPTSRAGYSIMIGMCVYLLLMYCAWAAVESNHFFMGVVFYNRLWLLSYLAIAILMAGLVQRVKSWRIQVQFSPRLPFVIVFLMTIFGQIPSSIVRFSGKVEDSGTSSPLVIVPVGMAVRSPPSLLSSVYNVAGDSGNSTNFIPWTNPTFSAVQVNMNGGRMPRDRGDVLNFAAIASYVQTYDPDLIALQSSETNRMHLGMNDAVEYLSWQLGRYSYYGWSPRIPSYGVALISKMPLMRRRVVKLPHLRSLLVAQVLAPNGLMVNVLVTQLSLDQGERAQQAQRIQRFIHEELASQPMVLLGDLAGSWVSPALAPVAAELTSACYTIWHYNADGPGQCGYTPKSLNVTECGYDTANFDVPSSPLWAVFQPN